MTLWKTLTDLSDLKYLRELYRKDRPKTNHGYYTLNSFIKCLELRPNIDHFKILVLENWKETGFYVIVDRFHLFINTLVLNPEEVFEALKLLDWSIKYKIFGLPINIFPIIEKTFQELNIPSRVMNFKIYQKDPSTVDDKELDIPDSLELRSITLKDAETINDRWYSFDGSLEHIRSLIEYNMSFGLYTKDSNELVAWCTRCQCGFIATLHVKNEYRGQGLAKILIEIFSRKVIESGEDARAIINDLNLPSQSLFRKLGFTPHENSIIMFNL